MGNQKPTTIFLIDREPFFQGFLEKALKARECQFFAIGSAEEALPFLRDLRPEVLLLDWDSLGLGEWSSILSEVDAQIPVVVLYSDGQAATGPVPNKEELSGQFPEHPYLFIRKPVAPEALLQQIHRLTGELQ